MKDTVTRSPGIVANDPAGLAFFVNTPGCLACRVTRFNVGDERSWVARPVVVQVTLRKLIDPFPCERQMFSGKRRVYPYSNTRNRARNHHARLVLYATPHPLNR